MEIITSYTRAELEQIITSSVEKALQRQQKPQPEPQDLVDIDEACRITNLQKASIYKLSSLGEIPCLRYGGKRLIFSKRELLLWMQSRTVRKESPDAIASKQLQVVANKRLR
jgi:predicted DNA-binding transcriptional regulator AlpA